MSDHAGLPAGRRGLPGAGALGLWALLASGGLGCGGCGAAPGPRLKVAALDEPSGIAASARFADRFYVHNDSGDGPRLFLVDAAGVGHGELAVEGAQAVDWETIAADGQGHLWIGDVGNNGSGRDDLTLYRVPEAPAAEGDATLKVDRRVRFRYAEQRQRPDHDRRFDAEALFFAPRADTGEGALYLLTKHRNDSLSVMYRFDLGLDQASTPPEADGAPLTPLRLAEWDVGGQGRPHGGRVTEADVSPDGRWLAVLTYHALLIFERPAKGGVEGFGRLHTTVDFDQDQTAQIEAVSWVGDDVIMLNEAGRIFRVPQVRRGWVGRFPKGSPAP